MTGFNLPPGCSVSDLPGNSKAEQEMEAAFDKLYTELIDARLIVDVETPYHQKLILFIMKKMSDAYTDGYQQAVADKAEFEEVLRAEEFARKWRDGNL